MLHTRSCTEELDSSERLAGEFSVILSTLVFVLSKCTAQCSSHAGSHAVVKVWL